MTPTLAKTLMNVSKRHHHVTSGVLIRKVPIDVDVRLGIYYVPTIILVVQMVSNLHSLLLGAYSESIQTS